MQKTLLLATPVMVTEVVTENPALDTPAQLEDSDAVLNADDPTNTVAVEGAVETAVAETVLAVQETAEDNGKVVKVPVKAVASNLVPVVTAIEILPDDSSSSSSSSSSGSKRPLVDISQARSWFNL
jgi:hypothetical protein